MNSYNSLIKQFYYNHEHIKFDDYTIAFDYWNEWIISIGYADITIGYFRKLLKQNNLQIPNVIKGKVKKRIYKIRKLAHLEFIKWGIGNWNFGFLKSKDVYGICYVDQKRIEISSTLIQVGMNDFDITDTIRHEIAHALDFLERGVSIHDDNWAKWCDRIGAQSATKAVYNDELVNNLCDYSKYYTVCKECNTKTPYFRRPKSDLMCSYCKLSNKHIKLKIIYNQNPKKLHEIV